MIDHEIYNRMCYKLLNRINKTRSNILNSNYKKLND